MHAAIPDTRAFLSRLTPRKVANAFLVRASWYLTRLLRRPVQWGLPLTVSIEPTTACNLRCPECPSGLRSFTRPTGQLDAGFFRKTIDELHSGLIWLIFYFQGEPYLHPDFLDMVRHARSKGLYTITSTNGHFLNDANARRTVESGLDRLIISIDGTTQEVYEQYRVGGALERVLQGARNVANWKNKLGVSHPYIVFQFLVVRPNEHQIPDIRRLARAYGADTLQLKSAQVYDYVNGNALIPTHPKYSRYRQRSDGSWAPKHSLAGSCWKLWHACVITWDGQVVPCCFDKDARHRLGDLKTQSFRTIWSGPEYRDFRKKLVRGRGNIDICTNCSEGCG